MSDGTLKPEKDYSDVLAVELPKIDELLRTDIQAAVERLLALEKQTRQSSDLASTEKLLVKIITIYKNAGDWKQMNEQVQLLAKKHGQLKQAITRMVQEVIKFLDEAPDMETKVETIENIRTVTEGKIFVEVERARVTRTLAKIHEDRGDINTAADLMCDLQVETYGSMDNREKTEFILEQVQLCVARGDFSQATVLSRKISTKYFDNPAVQDLRLRFYELMIQISLHDDKYLDVCKHYHAVYDTPSVKDDELKWKDVLRSIVYFVILAPFDNEQSDLIHRIESDTRLQLLPMESELIKCFTVDELMRWPRIDEIYGAQLRKVSLFDVSNSKGEKRWDDLRKRVIEHNIRVVAKYYTRIHTWRLKTLLDLSDQETETYLSDLVTQGTIYARINRPERIVTFDKPKDANDVLNEWSSNISSLLGLMETVSHLISKEEMVTVKA
ncbi:PCI domain-containing protein [Lipomyces kononenkoae]|uniref:PCI domain-containing protein n=1 Tax=Lipomyces kononenkoae TaxID=34357 RepID=A0ACC3T5Q9_LIPKO